MAVVPKKTYSRRNNGSSLSVKDKENVDLFDELLSSPLKQGVHFKPLSFWDRKIQELETNKKSKSVKWELYETSNSDDNSPNSRKENPRLKHSKHKSKKLPLKSISTNSNSVFSNVRSCIKKSKSTKVISTFENPASTFHEGFQKPKSQSLNNALNFSKSTSFIIKSSYDNCDRFEPVSVKEKTVRESEASFNGTTYTPRKESKDKMGIEIPRINTEKITLLHDLRYEVEEDTATTKEGLYDELLLHNNSDKSENITMYVNRTMEETLKPLNESSDDFRFISVKRHFSGFNNSNENFMNDSVNQEGYSKSPNKSQYSLNEIKSPANLTFFTLEKINAPEETSENSFDNVSTCNEDSMISAINCENNKSILGILNSSAYEGDDESTNYYYEEDVIDTTFHGGDILENTSPYTKHATALSEDTKILTLLELQTEISDLEKSSLIYNNNYSEDLTQELLLKMNENSTGAAESSSASDENPFYLTKGDSVISVDSWKNRNNTLTADFNSEKELPQLNCSPKEFSNLTTGISNLTISDAAESAEAEELKTPKDDINNKGKKDNSVLIDLRNVTTKRKYRLNGRYQRGLSDADECLLRKNAPEETRMENNTGRVWESNDTPEQSGMADKSDFDWSRTLCLANPIFESTRVQDLSDDVGKLEKTAIQSHGMASLLGESHIWMDHSYSLKPGKKWMRSVSVLRQIRNGSMNNRFKSTRIKGRNFESFVKDMLEMQNGNHRWTTSNSELTKDSLRLKQSFNRSLSRCYDNSELHITFKDSNVSMDNFDGTVLEKSLINPTIKVINPEEKQSTFELRVSNLAFQGESSDPGKSSAMTGRDLVLFHCGQDDILPFEEYFNERTLKDCRKIGEGVYGEVFRSSDVVIKIIPIEGSDKVNGEPQKTFDEILSEVVIALKLSNLRHGKENRTDGFSEVKRCWCVKGKYPKYLLRLWEEYDRIGNGSENDSPVMFKEDQLFIILELANGGRDLESFVFSSASQSLSVFLQAAFSLAAAEKAFEFEHRDLHWGNVLISETKDKFVTVVLEDVEYKIPSKGVKVCIIDFTMSRVYHEGFCIFNDLSVDPTLFTSEGDYQFEIYRMMLREVRNDWSLFKPKTNIFWLHYTLDKLINLVRYKNKKTKLHKKGERQLKILESTVMDYKDTSEFVWSDNLKSVLKRL